MLHTVPLSVPHRVWRVLVCVAAGILLVPPPSSLLCTAQCLNGDANRSLCFDLYATVAGECGYSPIDDRCLDCSLQQSTQCLEGNVIGQRRPCMFNFAMQQCVATAEQCLNFTTMLACQSNRAYDALQLCAWDGDTNTCARCSAFAVARCPIPRCALSITGTACVSGYALCTGIANEALCSANDAHCFWQAADASIDNTARCLWCGSIRNQASCGGQCTWNDTVRQCLRAPSLPSSATASSTANTVVVAVAVAASVAGLALLAALVVCVVWPRCRHERGPVVPSETPVETMHTATESTRRLSLRLTLPKSVGSTGSAPSSAMMAPALFQEGRVQRLKLLGRGANGSVYSCVLPDGTIIAMKEVLLPQSAIDSTSVVEEVMKEVSIVSSLDHPNVVRFYGSALEQEEGRLTIFMELVSSGSLASMVRAMPQPMSEDLACVYAKQITSALAYVHSCGVVHRDMKCDNLLLTSDGLIKLTDFGASKLVGVGTVGTKNAQTMIGTPVYMAPEVLLAGEDDTIAGYGKRADVWSLGITILEMLEQGTAPWPSFPSTGAAFMYISSPDAQPIIPERLSNAGKDFLRRCCTRDPAQRAKSEELLEHDWIRDVMVPLHRDGSAGSFNKMPSVDIIMQAASLPLSSGAHSQTITTSMSE